MIHQCKGLITENENEKIAGGEGEGSALILESQKRRSANPRTTNMKRTRGPISPE
jgi:hypothetical protein